MNRTSDPVRDYLAEVERALGDLPAHERNDILAGLREHIDAAMQDEPADDASVRDVLYRLGSPEDIAAEARGGAPAPKQAKPIREYVAAFLLTIGSVAFPIFGWAVGALMAAGSKRWRLREKLLAIFCPPFGFYAAVGYTFRMEDVGATRLVATAWWAGFGILLAAPFVTQYFLMRRLRTSAL